MKPEVIERQRLDQWLVFARFTKTRSLAQAMVVGGKVRINGEKCLKPDRMIQPGHVLTLATGSTIRVIRVEALAMRRGPAPEAALLYHDVE